MASAFAEDDGPQPPKQLKTPLEILASLRLLEQNRTPVMVHFSGHTQRFQSSLVSIERENNRIALDELVPNDGERFFKNQEPFSVEGFHEGIRIVWQCNSAVRFGEFEESPCYWLPFPQEVTYHQKRNAFRVNLPLNQLLPVQLTGSRLKGILSGQLTDISATGCRVKFTGNLQNQLQSGQVYEQLSIKMGSSVLNLAVEMRHLDFQEKTNLSFAGLRFYKPDGLAQRNIERFVYQLQREARQNSLTD